MRKTPFVVMAALALSLAISASAAAQPSPGPSATPAAASSVPAASGIPQELRDVRYCEVIPSVVEGGTITTYVYNTLGYNLCPEAEWSALTEEAVNEAFGSRAAKLNGPRHWVIDRLAASGASTTGATFTFGGIEMGLRGILTTDVGEPIVGDEPYVTSEVARDTVYTYLAGQPVFELTDPAGNVYVMQSYAQIVDPTLTYERLPDLATSLALPEGWTFSTRMLTEDLELSSDGLATIVTDDLANAYQRR